MTTWLEHLSDDECRERLASAALGRIAVMVDGHPEIFPVNHVYDPTLGVAFPTNDRTKLHAALEWPWISFEVDGIEDGGEAGWSVLVVGHALEVADPAVCDDLRARRHVRWGAASDHRWLHIEATKMTGRRISYVL
ncbi:MAG: pyridoxamine 5'-phosphate oxidase family protein [Acidobacteria bacterium]|nr:pyridoxamine 5'-phosphate oxidase family protein [Acidobacteriota bacterium]